MQAGFDFGLVAIADRFDEQVAEPLLSEKLTQDIEDSPPSASRSSSIFSRRRLYTSPSRPSKQCSVHNFA
jgi:hypothetical protein